MSDSDVDFYGCYYPNHARALNQTKCNANAAESWCCYIDDTCMDNGLCFQSSGGFANRIGRGTCSDSTWSSGACPQYCADVRRDNNLGLFLAFDRPDGAFCCQDPYNSTSQECTTGTQGSTQPFNINAGNIIYNRTNGAIIKSSVLQNFVGSATNATSTSSNNTVVTTATTTVTSNANIAPVAAGIAVPLAVLLIAALIAVGVLFSQNRRLRREAQATTAQHHPAMMEPKDYGPRSSITSPAPMYEYRQNSGQTNWAPMHAQDGQQHYYAKVADQPVNAHEVSADQIGELPGSKPAGT